MTPKSTKRRKTRSGKKTRTLSQRSYDNIQLKNRWVILLCGLLFLLFWGYGILSEGVYNDDDLSHYFNAKEAWTDPVQFLSVWNRPVFTLVYSFPAQLGFWAIELVTALLSAVICYLTYLTARRLNYKNAFLVTILVAFQPFFLLLSFSSLTEPIAAFLVILSLYFFCGRHFLSGAIVASLIPLARLELSVMVGFWAFFLLREKQWRSLLVLPVGVLLWNLAGFLVEGNPLWLYHQVFTGAPRTYTPVGFWHYFRTFIFIVGPVVFSFVLISLYQAIRLRRLTMLNGGFFAIFLTYVLLSWVSSAGQAAGFLRHFVAIAPLIGLLGLEGFNDWFGDHRPYSSTLVPLVIATLLCLFFLSKKLVIHHLISDEPEFLKFSIIFVLLGCFILKPNLLSQVFAGKRGRMVLLGGVVVFTMGYTLLTESPLPLSPEQQAMQQVSQWYKAGDFEDRVLLCNHGWLFYFGNLNLWDKEKYPNLTQASLKQAPVGSIVIWESHYAWRLVGDVPLEYFKDNQDFRLVQRWLSTDRRFVAYAFEKTRVF